MLIFRLRCIIKLGTPGTIFGFDVDTSHFSGNEAPEVSVQALYEPSSDPTSDDERVSLVQLRLSFRTDIYSQWTEILPRIPLGPNSRHLFKVPETEGVNFVKLNMYPDGGIVKHSFPYVKLCTDNHTQARFRVYGLVMPVFPANLDETFDLAHVTSGGRAVAVSDQHFGVGSNLILPGRGSFRHTFNDRVLSLRRKGYGRWLGDAT
jgi:allantoicase